MDGRRRAAGCLALALAALRPAPLLAAAPLDGRRVDLPAAAPADTARPAQRWPVPIVPNRGQADPAASHVLFGDATAVLFMPDGLSVRRITAGHATAGCRTRRVDGLCRATLTAPPPPDPLGRLADGGRLGDAARGHVDAVGWRFVGAQPHDPPTAEAPTGGRMHIFRGRPADWRTNLPFYRRIAYRGVWAGVDVVFDGGADVLKHTFIVAPGADPAAIALAWHGAAGLSLDDAGALVVDAPGGRIVDPAPTAYQVIDGRTTPVGVAYALRGQADGGWRYAFDVAGHDPSRPLFIDPALVVSAGFLGGAGADRGLGVELADDGHIWMVGELGDDAYAAKISPDGRRLLSLSVFDAETTTAGFDVDVDAAGSPYVVGAATAGEASFPVRGGPDLSYNGGGADAFIAKLTPDGRDIVYAGFLGGAGVDFAEGVAVDAQGHAYVHGLAESTEATFPVVVGPDLTQNGAWDAFVTKIVPEPGAPGVEGNLVWSGFVGGAGYDVDVSEQHYSSGHIAIDGDGNVYLSGQTDSREDSFPDGDGFGDLPGPDRTHNGGWDAYVAKIKADGTGLAYAGYIGGAFDDVGKGMAVDASGAAYLTGHTMSAPDTFPVAIGPDLTYAGRNDGFVAKLTPDGTRLAFCGYFGGDDDDSGQAVALGPDGALYLAGYTESTEATFPLVGGPDLTHNGPQGDSEDLAEFDVLVGRLKSDVGAADPRRNWDFLGLVGGAASDGAFWLDVDAAGDVVVVVGDTESDLASFPDGDGRGRVPGLPDDAHGLSDAFVVQVAWRPPSRRVAYLPWAGRSVLADVARATAPALPFVPTASSTPEPTFRSPTATASPKPPPLRETAVPPGESLVFWDDFSDPASGWRRFFLSSGTVGYVDGTLELATKSDELAVAHAPGVHFGDGAVEVTLQRGNGADALTGVVFGPRTGAHFWWLFPDGRQVLVLRNGDGVRALSPLASAGIANPRAPVRLRFERDGSRMRGYADGALMFDAADPSLAEPGVVGVALDAPDLGTARVRFDDVRVTRWSGDRPTAVPPTASATPGPTHTPPPGGRILFQDDFRDPATGWLVIDNASALARYVDGEYELTARTEGIYLAAFARNLRCANCAVEVSARFTSPVFGRLGIALGERDPDVLTFVEFAPDGRYAIERTDGTRWTTLAGPAASSAIRAGVDVVNRLRVERRNGRLTLVVNGTVVVAVDVAGLGESGPAGVVVLADEAGIVARFDDFVVKEE